MSAKHNSKVATIRRVRILSLLVGCAFAASGAIAAGPVAEQWAPGRLLVQPKPGLPDSELEKDLKPHGGKSIGRIEGINVHVVQIPEGSEKAVAALLAKNPHFKFAERDMLMRPDGTANDQYFAREWHLAKIGAPPAWDTTVGANQVIAILDTGVDSSHADLAGKIVPGWNFYSNNSDTSDVYGHGTTVAGAAAASTNNSIGVASVAPSAMIMPIRISDANGFASWSTVAQALTWAADQGVDVANISYGGVSASSTVQNAAQYMKNKGGVVVAAAGNNGREETYAANSTMITVSATDQNDVITSWSSYGAFVDIAAPGIDIYTTWNGGGYAICYGTSLASPVVAGALALIKAANPSLTPANVEKILFSSAADLGAAGFDKYYGYGRVDAAKAVQSALTATNIDSTPPVVSFASPSGGSTASRLVNVSVNATDDVGVTKVELRANGNVVATDLASPYVFAWDSTSVPDGNATLTAYAYDATGNYSAASVSVNVSNVADTQAPAASIKNPTAGTKVSGTINISAGATDNVGVQSIGLYLDGKLVASASGGSVSYNWVTRKAASGTHTLEARAQDAAGNTGNQSIQVSK